MALCVPFAGTQWAEAAASDFSWSGTVKATTDANPAVIDLTFAGLSTVSVENPDTPTDPLVDEGRVILPVLKLQHQVSTPSGSPYNWPLAQSVYVGGFQIVDLYNPSTVYVTADLDLSSAQLTTYSNTVHLNDALTVSLTNISVTADPGTLAASPILQMFNVPNPQLAMVLTFQYSDQALNDGSGTRTTYSATVTGSPAHTIGVPEPTTAAMAGLAGLALIRRKRG